MSDKIISIIRFFFKENFSQKRLFVILMTIVIMIVSFFISHKREWFIDFKSNYGNVGIVILLICYFLVIFILFEIICTKLSANKEEAKRLYNEFEMRKRKAEAIYNDLNSLSDWQKRFLLRNIMQGKSQVKSFEIGDYEAIWRPEMDVLVSKKIVTKFRYGIYEINPDYFDWHLHQSFLRK